CSPPFLPTHCIRRSLPTPHHLNWRSLAERTGEHREEVTICATFLRNCCGNGTAVAPNTAAASCNTSMCRGNRAATADPNGDRRGHIKDIVSIRQRPAAVEDRAVPGHWEGDLLSGPNNSYIATLVERHTRYVMLAKVAGKDTQTVVSALIK